MQISYKSKTDVKDTGLQIDKINQADANVLLKVVSVLPFHFYF